MTSERWTVTLSGMSESWRPDRGAWKRSIVLGMGAILVACGGPPPTPSAVESEPAITPTPGQSGLVASASPVSSQDGQASAPPPPSARPTPHGALILSEVLYDPLPGASAFIELANPTELDADLTGMRIRAGATDLAVPDADVALAAGGRLSIGLDGTGAVLDRRGGSAVLLDAAGETLDVVAWGASPGAVETGPGGLVPDSVPKGSVDRAGSRRGSSGRAPRLGGLPARRNDAGCGQSPAPGRGPAPDGRGHPRCR